jgi:predicted secreted protein
MRHDAWPALTTTLFTCGLLLFAPVACSSQPLKKGMSDSMVVTEKDSGGKVQLTPGGILTLKLKSVPGTGFAWHIARNEPHFLEPCGGFYFEPMEEDTTHEPLGAAQYQVFQFKAQKKGKAILELLYSREWEKKEGPQGRFIITVLIKKE